MKRLVIVFAFLTCFCSVASSSQWDILQKEKSECFNKNDPAVCYQHANEKRIKYFTDHFDEILEEANTSFTFQEKPIHPGLVKEFLSWISDPGDSTTVTVDVSARHRNEYNEKEVEIGKNGSVLVRLSKREYFSYKRLGKLSNGLHVLLMSESDGGSGVFKDLFFIKFEEGEAYSDEGIKYSRLLMSIVRSHVLGDRDDGKIKVLADKVILGKTKYRKDPVVFEFKN